MAILNPVKRKCNVLMSGPIMELNGITGPVYGCQLTNEQIIQLVNNGRKVVEIDPNNPSRKELLTIATCQKSVFGKEKAEVKEPIKEKEEVKREQNISNLSKKERKRLEWEERQKREKEAATVKEESTEVVEAVNTQTEVTAEKEDTAENDSNE